MKRIDDIRAHSSLSAPRYVLEDLFYLLEEYDRLEPALREALWEIERLKLEIGRLQSYSGR